MAFIVSCSIAVTAFCFLAGPTGAHRPNLELPPHLAPVGSDLEEVGVSGTDSRVAELEEALRPLYAALPKNEHGNLGPAAARYALHRLFRRMHAWLVKGFAPTGQAWNVLLPFDLLRDEMPEEHRLQFEQHLMETGFSLQVTAVFAAALENLVHKEAIERLGAVYNVLDLSPAGDEPWKAVEGALDVYMMSYILGDETDWTSAAGRLQIREVYPNWPATQRFTHQVLREVVPGVRETLTFADAARAVREIGARFGHFQDHECRELKRSLLALEEQCPARVPLGDFYGSNVHGGKWQFSESAGYLRELGVLDESDPERPSVIVPNYIDSPSNYVAASKFYSVSCLDECDPLMEHLERELAAPSATPEEIAAVVRDLPSSSTPAPTSWSASLLRRLDEIAQVHGGRVPLHGRLFAQWMHHAYPRSCPYPAIAGTSHPQLPIEYEKSTGNRVTASSGEMHAREEEEEHRHKRGAPKRGKEFDEGCLPWTMDEDYVAPSAAAVTPAVGSMAPASTALPSKRPQVKSVLTYQRMKASQSRAFALEGSLRPLYTALPKNAHGKLDAAAARYALHRLLRRTNAWLVKGLAPTGHAWNASSPAGDQQGEIPAHLRGIFDQHQKATGFTLGETALLAAALEELVHEEAVERLRLAYQTLSLSPTYAPWKSVEDALDVYMMSYILGGEKDWTSAEVRARIVEFYPGWPATQGFTRSVLHETVPGERKTLTFADAARAVREIGVRYGHWQDYECRELKQVLLGMEEQCPGRVPLGDFYGSAVHGGKWQFSESAGYLRELGVLDESDPERPSVIVPNYIGSPSNYVAYSRFYSVACLDECEPLMTHLEQELAAPSATPEEIAAVVRDLASASVPGSRSLPGSLLLRLEEIAQVHGGRVPLHGRLFAQWMHHAYPQECPYPRVSGTTRQQLPFEYNKRTGRNVAASDAEMHAKEKEEALFEYEAPQKPAEARAQCLPWTMEEELIAPLPAAASEVVGEAPDALRGTSAAVVLLAAGLCLVWAILRVSGKRGARSSGALMAQSAAPECSQLTRAAPVTAVAPTAAPLALAVPLAPDAGPL